MKPALSSIPHYPRRSADEDYQVFDEHVLYSMRQEYNYLRLHHAEYADEYAGKIRRIDAEFVRRCRHHFESATKAPETSERKRGDE